MKYKMLSEHNSIRIHLFGWFLFILYDAIIGGLVKGSFGAPGNYIVHYIINIGLFYLNALYVLPLALNSKLHSLWRLPLFLTIELIIYECVVYGIDSFLLKHTNILEINGLHLNKSFILAYVYRGLYFILFSTGYFLFRRYKIERDENEALKQIQFEGDLNRESLEKKMAEAKTAFLMAQINPHFLFNTLNFIYYTTVKNAPESAESIMLLSKIMRYSSDLKNSQDVIEIEKEAEYVQWLIEIHRIRFKMNFYFSFSFTQEAKKIKIIPFLLITVAENIFKHGLVSDHLNPARLAIHVEQDGLIITSHNKKKALVDSSGLGSGLVNLKSRMNAYYKNQANISYSEDSQGYFNLSIILPKSFP